ncbi:MAG TPA: ribonuclease P protein subunit [Candidatus Nanoarchaeia archaeon]|nr:ribonuclease P protein subunit [Candidatus Nanoarchaeia archaeon]
MTADELIGKKITIIESTNKSLMNVSGTVVDETKNILSIECDGKVKKVVKDQCVFMINGKKISGKDIAKKIEERIKK